MLPFPHQQNTVLIRDPKQKRWLHFHHPVEILTTNRVEAVLPLLQELEAVQARQGLFAAGWLAYEAAPGLDPVLKVRPPEGAFPLVWFGLYPEPDSLPALPRWQPADSGEMPFSAWQASITRPEYDAAIEKVKAHIACGDTYQVNYTFRLRADFQGNTRDALATFAALARAQNAPYAAYVRTDRFTLCSASPELFFSLDGQILTSRPMKGTAARGLTLAEDLEQAEWLRHSEKNRAENLMIVDMVRNDIGRVARTGSVRVDDLFCVEKYPTVWQMVTGVSGETGAPLSEIFQALFPAASITGAPKVRTMEIITELETDPRQVYTGSIGFISPQRRALFNVAIRTVLVDRLESRAEYGTGGGITWDSVDTAEFEESQTKAKILSVRFPHFSLLESILWTTEEGYFLLDLHLKRLMDSAAYFSFPVELPAVRQQLAALAPNPPAPFPGKEGGEERAGSTVQAAYKVRLLVDERGGITCQAERLPASGEGRPLRACLAHTPVDASNPFLYHKTTNRQVYEQARRACPQSEGVTFDETLLWNERGELTEFCTANLVVELDGALYTPPVSCGLLPGTYRAWLLGQGRVKERIIHLEELADCERILAINSVRGAREVLVHWADRLPGAPAPGSNCA